MIMTIFWMEVFFLALNKVPSTQISGGEEVSDIMMVKGGWVLKLGRFNSTKKLA